MVTCGLDMFDFSNPNILNLWIASTGLIVSAIVLFVTISTWKLKIGQSVRASYGLTTTDKSYVSTIIIENLKDRDLIIFGIYLKYGSNIYIDLLDIDMYYDRYHHIIPALSTRVFELGPVLYYSEHSFEVDIDHLLDIRNEASIILHSNMGKIKAKKFKKGWSPISQYFRNFGTHYIKVHRFYTKHSVPSFHVQSENYIDYSSYDKRVKYVVTLKFADGKVHDFDIPSIENYIPFKKLKFTPEVLSSCDTLKQYFIESQSKNLIEFSEFIQVSNIGSIIEKNKLRLSPAPEDYKIKILNKIQYHVIWRLRTCLHSLLNPPYPSKLYSFYCKLGIKELPNQKTNPPIKKVSQSNFITTKNRKKRRPKKRPKKR